MKTLIYLAIPYSDPNEHIRAYRFEVANAVAAKLMREGLHIFSPISHTHSIALAGGLPLGWDYWQHYDRAILQCCRRLLVLRLDGWEKSKGVLGEIGIAKEMGIQVDFMDPPDFSLQPPTPRA